MIPFHDNRKRRTVVAHTQVHSFVAGRTVPLLTGSHFVHLWWRGDVTDMTPVRDPEDEETTRPSFRVVHHHHLIVFEGNHSLGVLKDAVADLLDKGSVVARELKQVGPVVVTASGRSNDENAAVVGQSRTSVVTSHTVRGHAASLTVVVITMP